MILSGLHIYIALILKNKIPMKNWYFYSFFMGSIILDVDIYIDYIFSLLFFDTNYSFIQEFRLFHSFFFEIIVFLRLMYE